MNVPTLEGLSIFPNQSQQQWTITSTKAEITSIAVYDLQGKQVFLIYPDAGEASINGSGLSDGIYFSKITTRAGTGGFRLIKQ